MHLTLKIIQEKDGKRITSLQVELKNVFYPITPMTFDITKNKNVFPYSYYIEICKIFGNKPQLDLIDFNLFSSCCSLGFI